MKREKTFNDILTRHLISIQNTNMIIKEHNGIHLITSLGKF